MRDLKLFTDYVVATAITVALFLGVVHVAKADVSLAEMQALTPGVSDCVVPPDYWNGSPQCWNDTANAWSARTTILETAGLPYGYAAKFVRSIARNGYDFSITLTAGQTDFDSAILSPVPGPMVPVSGPLDTTVVCDALQKSLYWGGDPTQTSSYRRVRVAECPDLDNFIVQILPF